MSFVPGQRKKLSSHSEAQAEVHAAGCSSEDNSKQGLTLSTTALLNANES